MANVLITATHIPTLAGAADRPVKPSTYVGFGVRPTTAPKSPTLGG